MSHACSLGHLLLAPQRLPRSAAAGGEEALLDDLLAAIARVTADGAQGGTIVEDLEASIEALVQRLLQRAGSGLYRGVERLQDLVRPLAASLVEELPAMFDEDDAGAVADKMLDLVASLAEAAGGLSIGRLREQLSLLLDVLQDDLGLTTAVLEDEFWALVDDVVERVETIPDGLDAALRANRVAVAGALRRIRRRVRGTIALPELRADRLATLLFDVLDPLIGEQLKKVACVGHVAGDTLAAITALRQLVPFTGFGSGSIGAAEVPPQEPDREYLWYASWVLGDKDIEWYEVWRMPGDVWIDRTGTHVQMRFRRDLLGVNAALFPTEAFLWADIPIGREPIAVGMPIPVGPEPINISFKHPGPATMEKIAWHSAWAAEANETLFHIWSPLSGLTIKKGGQVSVVDLLDLGVGLGHTSLKAFKKMPFSFFAVPGSSWGRVVSWTPTIGAHLLGSLQGLHTEASGGNAFKFWALIIVPGDAIRKIGAGSVPGLLREGLLSFLTLYNYDGPSEAGDGAPVNYKQMDGMLAPFQVLGTLAMVKLLDRAYYGHPFTGNSVQVPDFTTKVWLEYFLLAGVMFGIVNGLLGTLVVWAIMAIAGSPATNGIVLVKNIGLAVLKSLGLFWINVYAFKENDTGGGTFNPTGGGDFAGYPDEATSPYLLPWNGGETYMCGQGNMGIFSHNHTNPGGSQVYAYDFMLDKGDEIRASRAGTVVDYFDWCPDDQDVQTTAPDGATVDGQTNRRNWNFISIRHDTPSADHDRGPGGTAVTTYSVYGHGLNSGVRDVFAARATPVIPANIIGTAIEQGDPIMLADSTGVSFCNHLHMQVEVGPAPTDPPPVLLSALGPTIPFVFADGGQPQSTSWHESGNRRIP